jgi:hypothetical protein
MEIYEFTKLRIYEIIKLLGLVKKKQPHIVSYEGVFTSGEFVNVLFDYDVGLLHVTVSSIVDTYDEKIKEFRFIPQVSISTVDDGVWQAFAVEAMSQEDANKLVEDIYAKWDWKYHLPSEQEMNEFLSQFKMWGEYTG